MPKIGKVWPEQRGQFDTEYATALYILTADSGVWSQAKSYVDRDGIDGKLREGWDFGVKSEQHNH